MGDTGTSLSERCKGPPGSSPIVMIAAALRRPRAAHTSEQLQDTTTVNLMQSMMRNPTRPTGLKATTAWGRTTAFFPQEPSAKCRPYQGLVLANGIVQEVGDAAVLTRPPLQGPRGRSHSQQPSWEGRHESRTWNARGHVLGMTPATGRVTSAGGERGRPRRFNEFAVVVSCSSRVRPRPQVH